MYTAEAKKNIFNLKIPLNKSTPKKKKMKMKNKRMKKNSAITCKALFCGIEKWKKKKEEKWWINKDKREEYVSFANYSVIVIFNK